MLQSRVSRALALVVGVLALSPAAASAQQVKGEYIVVMESDSTATDKTQTKQTVRAEGGKVEQEFSAALKGFTAELDTDALAEVRKDPDVAYVEPNQVVTISQQANATWGLDRIDQRNLPLNATYNSSRDGLGVNAYIIDTGVRASHSELADRVAAGYDAVDGGAQDDCNGHGTHVAGTVGGTTYGVAKRVKITPVRVLNCTGSGTMAGVIAGVDWVTAHHGAGQPAVANMSLGGGVSTALDTAVQRSISDGVTYAVAAGNSNANACNFSPARTPQALTVGASTNTDARASFSNYGSCTDLFAPGQSITSAWIANDTSTNTINGTSMASPHVAGAAALVLQGNPTWTPAQVGAEIVNSATTNVITNPGSGSPNRLLYTGPATPAPAPTPVPTPAPTCAAQSFSGNLATVKASAIQPNGDSYTSSTAGLHKGCLRGPAGTDFDLFLEKLSGTTWVRVARAESTSPNETINYNGTAGQYRWVVLAYSGTGNYTLEITKPT